jgi:hypothetical protein
MCIYICIYVYIYNLYNYGNGIYIYVYILPFQIENGSQAIFLNPFTVCSSCERKFVVCPFVVETNGSYPFPFANRLNGLNGLADLLLFLSLCLSLTLSPSLSISDSLRLSFSLSVSFSSSIYFYASLPFSLSVTPVSVSLSHSSCACASVCMCVSVLFSLPLSQISNGNRQTFVRSPPTEKETGSKLKSLSPVLLTVLQFRRFYCCRRGQCTFLPQATTTSPCANPLDPERERERKVECTAQLLLSHPTTTAPLLAEHGFFCVEILNRVEIAQLKR